MRLLGIYSITVKKYRPIKASKECVEERTNLLNQVFSTTSINQKWTADITCIPTEKDGWTYLASVIDLHSKKIIGYTYAKQMTTEIVMSVLDSAIQNQQPTDGLIIQTDLSSQYTSADFEEALRMNKMTHSYSRAKGHFTTIPVSNHFTRHWRKKKSIKRPIIRLKKRD